MYSVRVFLLLSLAVLAGGAEALAQDGPPTGVASEIERTASTSPQEKIAYAQDSNEEIREAERTVTKLLEQGRRDSDAEAIECLSNRLTSVRALLQVSESAEESMTVSIAGAEGEKASHEFRKIAVAVSKTRMLLAEAQRCASDQDLASGTTLVDWVSHLEDDGLGFVDGLDDLNIDIDLPDVSPFL